MDYQLIHNGYLPIQAPAPFIYESRKYLGNGWTVGKRPNGRYAYFNDDGLQMIGRDFHHAVPFAEGLAAVMFSDTDEKGNLLDGAFSFINGKGELAFGGVFATDSYFSEGLACVSLDDITYFYIDKNGQQAFPGEFFSGNPFFHGLAVVEFSPGDWGYINRTGKRIET